MNMITVEGINYYKHMFRYSGLVLILLFIEQSEVLLVFGCLGVTGGKLYSTTFPQIRRVRVVSPTNVYLTSRSDLLVSFARVPADENGHDRGLVRSPTMCPYIAVTLNNFTSVCYHHWLTISRSHNAVVESNHAESFHV